MVKPEWGTKRSCPKCGTRFYDLGAEDPVTCIACGNAWVPEPILKSKQPLPFEQQKPQDAGKSDNELNDDDLDISDEDEGEEEEVDLGGDDDLGVAKPENKEDI